MIGNPNTEDLQEIQTMLKGVSWADTCDLVHDLGTNRVYLNCRLYLLAPCHFSKLEESIEHIKEVAARYNVKAGVILYGDCTHLECDRATWIASKANLVIYWNGYENMFRYTDFLMHGPLEGIEWWNPENWKATV